MQTTLKKFKRNAIKNSQKLRKHTATVQSLLKVVSPCRKHLPTPALVSRSSVILVVAQPRSTARSQFESRPIFDFHEQRPTFPSPVPHNSDPMEMASNSVGDIVLAIGKIPVVHCRGSFRFAFNIHEAENHAGATRFG